LEFILAEMSLSSPPSYDAGAAASRMQRVLEFLDRV